MIRRLKAILASEKELYKVIKSELAEIREKYADARRTELVDSFAQIVIEEEAPVADEALIVITRAGFVKRMLPKAYERAVQSGEENEPPMRRIASMTDEKILFITDLGNCYPVSVAQIPECRLKDRGLPLGGLLAGLDKGETLIEAVCPGNWEGELMLLTRKGLIKRMALGELNVRKGKYAVLSIKDGDKLVSLARYAGEESVLVFTEGGMAIHFAYQDMSVLGRGAAGVKAMTLAPGDAVLTAFLHDSAGEALLVSELGYMKRCLLIDFDRQSRGGKGLKAFNFLKNGMNGSRLVGAMLVKQPFAFTAYQKGGQATKLNTDEVPIGTRASKGESFVLVVMDDFLIQIVRIPE